MVPESSNHAQNVLIAFVLSDAEHDLRTQNILIGSSLKEIERLAI